MDVSGQSVQCSGWLSQRSVSPPGRGRAVPRGSVTVGGALLLRWMAAGQRLGRPPATDVIAAFLVSTPARMCARPRLFVSVGQQQVAAPSKRFLIVPVCPYFSPRLAAVRQT